MQLDTVKLGVRNLLLHKLRSFLTALGIILGVSSVISMLAIGEGSKQEALERIRELGASNVIIRSDKPKQEDDSGAGAAATSATQQQQGNEVLEYGLKYKDFEVLKAALPTIRLAVPIALVRKNAQHERYRIANARIFGTTPDYLDVKNLSVRRGRFLTGPDVLTTANVAVLAAGAAQRLFNYEDPLAKPLLLGPGAYTVVGVLDRQGSGDATPGAIGQQNFNNDIYIPITAAQCRFGEMQVTARTGGISFERTQLHEITLVVNDQKLVSQTADMARRLLQANHPKGDDVDIQVPLELLHQEEEEKRIWNLVLGSIAGISLLVGGIGIMNIMLATVTERTREIGVRRALGAKRRDITLQFLVETVLLSLGGGILGILVGVTIPLVVSRFSEIETVLSVWSILLAFGIAAITGVVFGIYPARRAALMDPIEALRHE